MRFSLFSRLDSDFAVLFHIGVRFLILIENTPILYSSIWLKFPIFFLSFIITSLSHKPIYSLV